MAGGLQGHRGGIHGLLTLIDEHQEALEYDLIALGLRLDWLGTSRLDWRDLLVIVKNLPRTSATNRAANGETAQWSLTDYLLAGIFDLIAVGNWQRAGKKNAPRPKPLPRPGDTSKGRKFGSKPIPIKDFTSWWEKGR
jgi:hypothetical protein